MRAPPTLLLLLVAGAVLACAGAGAAPPRDFAFDRDTFAYGNDLVWEYAPDGNGGLNGRSRGVDPDYARYCFVLARTARQFFGHARFAPERAAVDAETYRALIRQVVNASPAGMRTADDRIVFPGYASLRALSVEYERLLKEESGGWWRSYLQRGNWRMILPFSRWHQARQAASLARAIEAGEAPIVHLVRFPRITINHAVVLYGVRETEAGLRFEAYDPNQPEAPTELRFDREDGRFRFPRTHYFAGGRADVYRIYHSWLY
jgi:hypothetical protein